MLWYIVIIVCTYNKRTIIKPRTASYNLYFVLERGTICGPVYVDLFVSARHSSLFQRQV